MFFNKLVPADHPNKKWEVLFKSGILTVGNKHVFNTGQKFFTIGSCFAEEIRKALTSRYVTCYPEYSRIRLDPDRMQIDTLPQREHMNYYNTFSIRQEIERAAGLWVQDRDDIWPLKGRTIENGKLTMRQDGSVWQDPYRRLVFGKTEADLWSAIDQINTVMKEGMAQSDVLVMTLGMTEVFRKKNNGLVCNQIPVYGGGAGLKETEFHASDYEENLANLRRAFALLRQINPAIQVVLTVSPVPLQRSFGPHDIFVNNYESKCTLRAVAAKICRELDWVHYFPSFEIVWGIGDTAYQARDRLHVKEEVVGRIIDVFLQTHFEF
ncbi:MAG: GSCFA domain-containing protein [Thiobacillus sp.]|nr:GSCFA domain-containing protein [Thiobacillus sp.]